MDSFSPGTYVADPRATKLAAEKLKELRAQGVPDEIALARAEEYANTICDIEEGKVAAGPGEPQAAPAPSVELPGQPVDLPDDAQRLYWVAVLDSKRDPATLSDKRLCRAAAVVPDVIAFDVWAERVGL